MYYFGLYHWRQRFRRAVVAIVVANLSAVLWSRRPFRGSRPLALAAALAATARGIGALSKLLRPPPWALERYKYDALFADLALDRAERVLDVGCGTGRSLVGLAPHLPENASVLGLDVFDDRVILGNAPLLARRNALEAGIEVSPMRGDAARLPVVESSQDVVTACRVLHDLPEEDVDGALRETRRVCAPGGALGVLELPIVPHGVESDPEEYWRSRVSKAGFSIRRMKRIERPRGGDPYLVIVAEPSSV